MTFGARRRGELHPGRGGAEVDVVRRVHAASGRADNARVQALGVGGVQTHPEDRVAEGMQRLPCGALVGGIQYLSVGIRRIEKRVRQTRAGIEVVDVRGRGVENAALRVLHDAIDRVARVAGVMEGPGASAVGAPDAPDVRKGGEERVFVAPEKLPARGVFQAAAPVTLVRNRGVARGVLAAAVHVRLPPGRAPVRRPVCETHVRDKRPIRVEPCHREPDKHLAVAPAAVAALAGPARGDVRVARRAEDIRPARPAVDAL